jgi:hypothetical protein
MLQTPTKRGECGDFEQCPRFGTRSALRPEQFPLPDDNPITRKRTIPATTTSEATTNNGFGSNLDLTLVITDPNILLYLSPFDSVEAKTEKVMEALKVGVIAIQSASPTLDTRVVQAKFTELEARLKEYVTDFQEEIGSHLQQYFKEGDGVIPRSLDGVFGTKGSFAQTMAGFFDPAAGRVSKLMQTQIGPDSTFGRALDPRNKDGILSAIEARVETLVQAKLDEVLAEFSLDTDGSAMSRLKTMLWVRRAARPVWR